MNELLILRHGKSNWKTGDSDFYRPLKNRGKRNAQQMGCWLAQQGLTPDIIIASPAVRALSTAEKASKAMGKDTSLITTVQTIYAAGLGDLLHVLSKLPDKHKRVMLVGHNPGLEDLLLYLVKKVNVPDDGKLLPTATVAHIELKQSWNSLKSRKAHLKSITRPKTLPCHFPYETENGIELRDRPAYYYSQSAIIPYRYDKGKLQILLIGSSSCKHWIIPKGIIEPGLSPVRSAEKEALEEAGVKGIRNKYRLGQYHYQKWGSICTVDVFSMEVTDFLPNEQWQENHRKRLWVSYNMAKKLIKEPALIPIFKQLKQQNQ